MTAIRKSQMTHPFLVPGSYPHSDLIRSKHRDFTDEAEMGGYLEQFVSRDIQSRKNDGCTCQRHPTSRTEELGEECQCRLHTSTVKCLRIFC